MSWTPEAQHRQKAVGHIEGHISGYDWRQNFVKYRPDGEFYIYCDTNASYASIHQYLEDAMGMPAVVANGNVASRADAGACLAISYEAREKGIRRGASLRMAMSLLKDLRVFESCLPLYELYAEIYDNVLEWIVCRKDFYRGSCDEVAIRFKGGKYPWKGFQHAIRSCLDYARSQVAIPLKINIESAQEAHILSQSIHYQNIYAVCYLARDLIQQVLGLPISISVAPSLALAKTLIELAKPRILKGHRAYKTFHAAIAFPHTADEANSFLRGTPLQELCGIKEIGERLAEYGVKHVSDVQDFYDINQLQQLSRNKHLGTVVWYMCHGRDDVLSGYLSAIRDRK